jgi:hypothetical protein
MDHGGKHVHHVCWTPGSSQQRTPDHPFEAKNTKKICISSKPPCPPRGSKISEEFQHRGMAALIGGAHPGEILLRLLPWRLVKELRRWPIGGAVHELAMSQCLMHLSSSSYSGPPKFNKSKIIFASFHVQTI